MRPHEDATARSGAVSRVGDPQEKPTLCTFYPLPASVATSARAVVFIEGGVPGDSIICHSHGTSAGLKVNVSIVRGGKSSSGNKFKTPASTGFRSLHVDLLGRMRSRQTDGGNPLGRCSIR
jgi:hypothetical protein